MMVISGTQFLVVFISIHLLFSKTSYITFVTTHPALRFKVGSTYTGNINRITNITKQTNAHGRDYVAFQLQLKLPHFKFIIKKKNLVLSVLIS